MARTSAKAKKQRQEATRNRDKGEESADSLPSDNQENIENGAQKEKQNRKTITKKDQEDSDFEVITCPLQLTVAINYKPVLIMPLLHLSGLRYW